MAENIKPMPSPPPAEPRDVTVVPSPPPAEPFDVQTTPSPPPREPFDVKTYPDPPPGGTFDVPVSPDPGPAAPFDVATSPDPGPAALFDVPTMPDAAPRDPFDVVTSPDGPPAEPFDVNVAPDLPPAAPFDVQTEPSVPPAAPVDVGTSPDPAPAEPFNVGVTPSPPPAEPFDVSTEFSPPPVLLEGGSGGKPTIEAIISAVGKFDERLGAFLGGLLEINPISISTAGAGALDPTLLAKWFRDYVSTVGPGAVGRFIAEQGVLYAMNPEVARVFDPTYFIRMMIPGSMGNFTTTLDTKAGITGESVARLKDELLQGAVGLNPNRPGGRPDVYGPENTMRDGQDFSIDEMVDAAVDGVAHPFMSPISDQTGLTPVKKFDAGKYFEDRQADGSMRAKLAAKFRASSGAEILQSRALAASNFLNGVVRVPIGPNEDPDGAVYSQTQNPTDLVDDDDARVPVCFTDLRKDPVRNAFRSVYFRPLNLSFAKSISPEWSEGGAFGRVDPIVSYQRTTRTYSVSFELHAFAPEDLGVMYNKMVWLDSMCYPMYGSDSLMRSGPVIRMRIGDAVSTESGGLTGVIKSLNFDFADALWELKKGMKVPRSFKVSLEFLALHEGPVGLLNGTFGVFQLPTQGTQADVDTNNPGAPTESRESPARVATALPGRFAKFGEPRR